MAAVLAVLVAGGPAQSALGADPPSITPSFVILLDGMCSELPTGATIPAAFAGPDGLVERLEAAGWSSDAIATFSYRGGSLVGGLWQPLPYGCADSRDQGIKADIDRLAEQIDVIAAIHPMARFHLVGFSQGGLIAFGYLARVVTAESSTVPGGVTIASVTTLDSPLGGAPFVELLCSYAPDICGGSPVPAPASALYDMSQIWKSSVGTPAGAKRSVASVVAGNPAANQVIAAIGAARGIEVLTVGNVRDWMYAPAGPDAGKLTFLDSQWLTTDPRAAGVHSRAITSGPASCPAASGDLVASYGCNHALVTRDAVVADAIVAVLAGHAPALASTCSAGHGGCLALPPRPATTVKAVVAAGIVTGGGHFGTSAVKVKSGGRATILFTTSPAVPGAVLEIWGRGARGAYRFMTKRVADRHGVVRYYTPPITAWAAIQARYPGDYVNGPGVSAGRVITIR